MRPSGDLTDPSYEPTDDELTGLCKRAFDVARAEGERAQARVDANIELARAEALRAYRAAHP